jgi:hypothetical protein
VNQQRACVVLRGWLLQAQRKSSQQLLLLLFDWLVAYLLNSE